MKATGFQNILIILRSGWFTFWISSKVLCKNLFSTMSREWFDKQRKIWASALLSYVKVKYQVFDPHHLTLEPGRCYIVMSNHGSLYDIPLLFLTFPKGLRMIAKKELFKVPVWGSAMKAGEIMIIDRQDRRQAIKDLAVVKEKMSTGIIPWIAPEGTRTRTGLLQPFKKGGFMIAMQTEATIIPVGIRGARSILPPDTFFDFHLHGSVEIHIGRPIDTRTYSSSQRDDLMKDVENAIRQLMGES